MRQDENVTEIEVDLAIDFTSKKVLSERCYKVGYVIKNEEYQDGFQMKSAYTHDGDYIGNSKMAHFLCKKRGIKPEKRKKNSNTCSVGFCESEQKWYGWSHRAIAGFGIGDMLYEVKYQTKKNEKTPFTRVGKVKIKNLNQAKQASKNFAKYVS